MLGEAPELLVKTPRRAQALRADRILVIRLGALGDVLRTLPAVKALRALHPGSHLCWLVEPAAAPAVAAAGCVDELLVFPRGELVAAARRFRLGALVRSARAFRDTLRARRFDLVLDFHGLAKSGLLAWLSGAPVRVGHRAGVAREGASLFVNRRVDGVPARISRYARNAALLRALSPRVPVPDGPLLSVSPAAGARVAERLRTVGRADAAGFVLIHPGSSDRARHKRYPASAWVAVVDRLCAAELEVWLVAGGSAEERALADRIVADGGGRALRAPDPDDFEELVALIARAGVFASGDTGPLHAASLAGVPVVQLLGPTDPLQNEPGAASEWRRVHVPLPCSPCRRGCAEPACMHAIAPARAADAILALARHAAPSRARTRSADRGEGP